MHPKKTLALIAFWFIAAAAICGQSKGPQAKLVTDQREYNAFMSALRQYDGFMVSKTGNPAPAFEEFCENYPGSAVLDDALDKLLAVYQRMGNSARMASTAERLLQVNPTNVRGLAVLASARYAEAKSTQDAARATQLWNEAQEIAKRGLNAAPLMNKSDFPCNEDAYVKSVANVTRIFNTIVAMSGKADAPDLPPVFIPPVPPFGGGCGTALAGDPAKG